MIKSLLLAAAAVFTMSTVYSGSADAKCKIACEKKSKYGASFPGRLQAVQNECNKKFSKCGGECTVKLNANF